MLAFFYQKKVIEIQPFMSFWLKNMKKNYKNSLIFRRVEVN